MTSSGVGVELANEQKALAKHIEPDSTSKANFFIIFNLQKILTIAIVIIVLYIIQKVLNSDNRGPLAGQFFQPICNQQKF